MTNENKVNDQLIIYFYLKYTFHNCILLSYLDFNFFDSTIVFHLLLISSIHWDYLHFHHCILLNYLDFVFFTLLFHLLLISSIHWDYLYFHCLYSHYPALRAGAERSTFFCTYVFCDLTRCDIVIFPASSRSASDIQ